MMLAVTSVGFVCKIPFIMSIGQRIKRARLSRKPKITQQQLADAVGVSRQSVTQWETGETKTLEGEHLLLTAKALGVTARWLLYGEGSGPGELLPPVENLVAANDSGELSQRAPSQRALMVARMFDELSLDQQDAMQKIIDALAQSVGHGHANSI